MWGLNGTYGISAPSAWNSTTGSKNVRVGVIDTGVASHPDLNANVTEGWDFYNNNAVTTDDTHSHGTHVARTIGADGNNGMGITGVNWNVTIVPLQASNADNLFDHNYVIKAINWATSKWETDEQIDIINYSVAGFGYINQLIEAINNFPGLFIWAAGNDNANVDSFVNSEAFVLPNLISVGSIDRNGNQSYFSNYGKNTVDIFAPGGSIYSTVLNNGYGYKSGTSMAAPHVTGVAALLLSEYPDLTAAQLKNAIMQGATKEDNLTNLCISGGRINAYNALMYLHTHNYNKDYVWVDNKQHSAACECGASKLRPHAVSAGETGSSTRFKLCLFCGGRAEYGIVVNGINSNKVVYITDNGSFILPNGVVVLVDNDIQAYIDGTLKFYDKYTVKQ